MGAILGPVGPPPPRLDRDEYHIGILYALMLSGVGIFLLPIDTGTVAAMEAETQKLLAVCMMIGSFISLSAASLGKPLPKILKPLWWLAKKIIPGYDYLPVRHCYRLGVCGLVSILGALAVFSWNLLTHGSLIGTFTGLMTPILFVVMSRRAWRLWSEASRMDREFEVLKHIAIEDDGGGDSA